MTMESLRKWFYKPKRDDTSLLAQFFFADEALNMIASELDSFDGRKDPERCTALVNILRQSQDRVLNITNAIMDVLIPNERANRDFRVKFPEDVLQENLAGQLWFGAECLAAGSSIMNREAESAAMRPLAKALTKSLENVRNLLREACLRNNTPNGPLRLPNNEFISESLKIFDRIFAEFELSYVSAMVPVKTTQEYELQELIGVLFSETLQRALKMKLLTQEQVDDYDPALMFTIPRLAIVSGLLIYPNGPLCIDKPLDQMSEMFRPFKMLLHKIRELLWTLNKRELYMLEKLLCDNEQFSDYRSMNSTEGLGTGGNNCDLDEFVNRFYSDYPLCKDFVSNFYVITKKNEGTRNENGSDDGETDFANEAAEVVNNDITYINNTASDLLNPTNKEIAKEDSVFPDYETISDSSLPALDNLETSSISSKDTNNALTLSNALPSSHNATTEHFPASPLEGIISNVIADLSNSTNYSNQMPPAVNIIAPSPNFDQRPISESIDIPSGFTLIDRYMDEHQQDSNRVDSLPDRDSMEAISVATATLSTLLSQHQPETSELLDDQHDLTDIVETNQEVKDDCLYCGELKDCEANQELKKKMVGEGNSEETFLESPVIDSGISTENTSLDRSPSLDLGLTETATTSQKPDETPTSIVISSSTCVTVTTIPCQCNVDPNPNLVKNIEINYSEASPIKNETTPCCGVLSSSSSTMANADDDSVIAIRTSNDDNTELSASTSKNCTNNSKNASPRLKRRGCVKMKMSKRSHQQRTNTSSCNSKTNKKINKKNKSNNTNRFMDTLCIPGVRDSASLCSSETSSFNSECADDEEIALAMQAAEIANRNEARAKFRSSEDLVHRLFVCIAGVADQLQTNFASDLRNILKAVFLMNASSDSTNEQDEENGNAGVNLLDQINDSIEYRASESDIVHNDEFSIDPNILAQEALFDTNVYFQIEEQEQRDAESDEEPSNVKEMNCRSDEGHSGEPSTQGLVASQNNGPLPTPPISNVVSREESPPVWIPDIQAPKCMSCEANFTVVKRRHHCRNCGKVFCARCSANSVPLPKYGHHKPVRVCNKCFMYHLTPFTM